MAIALGVVFFLTGSIISEKSVYKIYTAQTIVSVTQNRMTPLPENLGNRIGYSNSASAVLNSNAFITQAKEASGIDGVRTAEAVLSVFPLDTYSVPAFIMDLTDGDKEKHMPIPVIWADYEKAVKANGGEKLSKLERFEFYERAKKAYAIIQTGEERQYGNLLLVKGVVL